MNAILLEQTTAHLTRRVRRWDRRLRLVRSVLWEPRGLIAGLTVSIGVAVLARLRPWLFPEQVALIAGGVTLVSALSVIALIWFWPQSTGRAARYFDRRFNLKERVSTALELSGGTIPLPERLVEHQLSDAVGTAQRVNAAKHLPLRVRYWEIVILVALGGLLAYLLIAENPQAQALRARRDLKNAIDSQAEQLQETIQAIENNNALTEAEQQALAASLKEALEILSQPTISQQEAVAALAAAQQSLQQLSDGMLRDQEQAYQQAASQLAGSDLTSDLAQALKKPDLGQTAQAADRLADQVGQQNLTETEQQALADQLDQAAEALAQSNPALAQKLREAAQQLREGNTEVAEQALREAAETLRQQQKQLANSPLADAAESAQQQVNEGQQTVAQAGQQNQNAASQQAQTGQPQSQQGQSSQPQAGQPQSQQGQPAGSSESQPGQQPEGSSQQPGQSGEGQPGQSPQGSGGQSSAQGEGGQQSGEQSQSSAGGQDGSQDSLGGADQQSSQANAAGGESQQAMGGAGAGEGEGGAGVNDTAGMPGGGQGDISTDNSPGASDGIQNYTPQNDSSLVGGEGDQTVDIGGQGSSADGSPVQEGDFGPNPAGESTLSYTNVFSNYRGVVSNALDSGRIPLDQRDVIHDYFSSLEP